MDSSEIEKELANSFISGYLASKEDLNWGKLRENKIRHINERLLVTELYYKFTKSTRRILQTGDISKSFVVFIKEWLDIICSWDTTGFFNVIILEELHNNDG
jgi:hypothetical protein